MSHRFDTKAIHAGQPNEELTGAVTTPIFQTSTFEQISPGEHRGFSYSRTANPTRQALEGCLAELEGGDYCVALASGLAAVSTCLNLLKQGDHVVACRDLYGGSYRQFTKVYSKFGLEFSFADTTDTEAIAAALRPNTKLLWLESPSNPLLRITDIESATSIAHDHGVLAVVDNTFATPCLQQPLALGADIVLHSTTKYLNGHSDVIGGALITSKRELAEELRFYQNSLGAVPAPMDCYLTLRGIKTLVARMEKHCRNAAAIARYPRRPPGRQDRLLPRPGIAPRSRDGSAPAERFWRNRLLRARRRAGGNAQLRLAADPLHASGIAGIGEVVVLPSGDHDSLMRRPRNAKGKWDLRQPHTPERGHRARRRSARRSRTGPLKGAGNTQSRLPGSRMKTFHDKADAGRPAPESSRPLRTASFSETQTCSSPASEVVAHEWK